MSLFKQIGGRSGEDVATEIVEYMLKSENEYIPFQKIFYHRVLGSLEEKLHEARRKIYIEILDPYIRLFSDLGGQGMKYYIPNAISWH